MRILGSDYDGTLTVGGITDQKIDAINKWRAYGNKFGIVSGRNNELRQHLKNQSSRLEVDFLLAVTVDILPTVTEI